MRVSMGMGSKGSAFVWLAMIIMLIVLSMLYIIVNEGVNAENSSLLPMTESHLTNISSGTNNTMADKSKSTIADLRSIWQYFLILPFIVLIMWAFVETAREGTV